MLPALLQYEAALRNPQIPPKAIVRMVKGATVTEADVIAARAELAAGVVSEVVSVVETVAEAVAAISPDPKVDAVVEVVTEVAGVVEHGADLLERVASGPRMKPQKAIEFILAVLGVTDADGDGDVDALDALNAVFAAITKRPGRGVVVEPAEPAREPGAAVRALRTDRIVDAGGKPWRVSFRDVYSGDKADFLVKHHPALVESFPPRR